MRRKKVYRAERGWGGSPEADQDAAAGANEVARNEVSVSQHKGLGNMNRTNIIAIPVALVTLGLTALLVV